jgi:hypothetical protein
MRGIMEKNLYVSVRNRKLRMGVQVVINANVDLFDTIFHFLLDKKINIICINNNIVNI